MTDLIHIADRVLNRPLLVTRDKAQVILSVLAGRIGVNAPEASRFEGDRAVRDENGRVKDIRSFNVAKGVGIITITGSLVARGAWVGASSGLTSYEGIQHQIKSARDDDGVHSAIIDLHTPGGEAVLAFETAALVRELSAKKPTIAIINGMAASAGYAIASGAREIVTTETGVSGSIGVVLLHADFSRQLDRDGITPTLIHAGAHKVDGNPFEPLSSDVRDDLQAEVNAFYDAFLATVAKGRGGRLTAAAARKTEARTFIGKAAVDVGLADRVGTFESVLAELQRAGGRNPVQQRRTSMDDNDKPAPAAGISQAAHDKAVADARAEGQKAGATAERERFKAVMSADAYKGREAAATHMLTTTEMTADAILGVLGGIPAAEAAAPAVPGARSKDAAGGLVVEGSASAQPQKETPSASWAKSIDKANARFN